MFAKLVGSYSLKNENKYVKPYNANDMALPSDEGYRVSFPRGIKSPAQKIKYALYREGRQGFENLVLLTGLAVSELKSCLDSLIDSGEVLFDKKNDLYFVPRK